MEIKVVRQILEWNEDCHHELQNLFNEKKILMINVMGSPGGGKTTFITRFIEALRDKYNIGIIEADIAGKIDAERISALGIPVVQLNTDGACHTEAMSIKNILPYFNLDELDILIVENIGNLVCPAEFDIGEHLKIALLSVPEGDDKVEKYPLMFAKSNALLITKFDMKSYFNFDDDKVVEDARKLNNDIKVFRLDNSKGIGIEEVARWVDLYIENVIKSC